MAPRTSRSSTWPRCASIPNLTVIRPADAKETVEAWQVAIAARGPGGADPDAGRTWTSSTAATLPPASELAQGAYVLGDVEGTPDVILIASGSEVQVALARAGRPREQGRARRAW